MRRRATVGLLVGMAMLFLSAYPGTASAASEGAIVIAERQAIMWSMQVHFNAIKKDIGAGDNKAVEEHASAINGFAKVLINFFPKGSGSEAGKTRALPKIWEDWDKFTERPKVLAAESEKLMQIAKSGGDAKAMGDQFAALGKDACGACHENYRARK